VRAATDETVQAVGQIETAISEMNQVATAIAAAVQQQGSATEEISRSVARTTEAARQVASRVASVSAGAVQSGVQADEVHKDLSELAKAVVDLKHVVVRIVRTSTAEVNRRREVRTAMDLPARMTVDGSATTYTVRLKDLSPHGAQIVGCPAVRQNTRGSLAIEGAGMSVIFNVQQVEDQADGHALHLKFEVTAEVARAIANLLQRHGEQTDVQARAA
jgi:methyl-accepting chemotaxis protein